MVRRKAEEEDYVELPPPAKTLEGIEDQLIAAAMDLAHKRLLAGTASAQETVHFARLGSRRNQLEQEKLVQENELLKTRVKELESRKSSEELYKRALDAMRGYAGKDDGPGDEEYYD